MLWLPRGHFSARFGSQEGTLVHVFQQLSLEPPLVHITGPHHRTETPPLISAAVGLINRSEDKSDFNLLDQSRM